MKYVERNPVRAGLVKRAEDYPWSSARAHVFGTSDPLLDPGLPLIGSIGDWAGWLSSEDAEEALEAIRTATARDLPLGEEEFILRLEPALGRPLRPRRRGRKPRPELDSDQLELEFDE